MGKLPCPANQTENITTWKAAYNKYITYKNGKYCKILADADGIIIEQVTTSHVTLCGWYDITIILCKQKEMCKFITSLQSGVISCTTNEKESIRVDNDKSVIGKKFCCTNDGCNWNAVTGTQIW